MVAPSIFGQRLKTLREARDLTQEELSARAGISAAMISHFETGRRQRASADNFVKLANALDVTIDYLIGRSDEPQVAGERFAAAFRGLSQASSETVDSALAVVKTLVDGDRQRRDDGTKGKGDPEGS